MPSVYISEKNFMAAYQRAFEEKTASGKDVTAAEIINRVLCEQLRKRKDA